MKFGAKLVTYSTKQKYKFLADTSYWEKVYEVTKRIPRGRVSTYGAIAEYLSLGSARMVGWALNHAHSVMDVPAHRVVNRVGELSGRHMFATPTLMQERLESEGVEINNDKVRDFKQLFWHPGEVESSQITTKDGLQVESILDLAKAAEWIIDHAAGKKIFLFEGGLGAGKTTTIKALCKYLNVEDATSSPTFSLVNEYRTKENGLVYHMDLYRLNTLEEALDIGIEEYLYSDAYVFIEWPEKILPILDEYVTVSITRNSNGTRRIQLQ